MGLKYEAKVGNTGGSVFVGATASGGVAQDRNPATKAVNNRGTGTAEIGGRIKLQAFGKSALDIRVGAASGEAAPRVMSGVGPEGANLGADATIRFSATIPVVWAGPVPVGGIQVTASLNVPAAWDQIRNFTAVMGLR